MSRRIIWRTGGWWRRHLVRTGRVHRERKIRTRLIAHTRRIRASRMRAARSLARQFHRANFQRLLSRGLFFTGTVAPPDSTRSHRFQIGIVDPVDPPVRSRVLVPDHVTSRRLQKENWKYFLFYNAFRALGTNFSLSLRVQSAFVD